ncbi:DUF3244 domain-containing protein [uncultured Parabacteroides sp.]|uniref:DUF3244 domain-containing protein n=1 Tax=uncultured Parabacteroides sp. TaxID=512312 RepID=UPI002621D3F8|nr:DUF3244 domain-containing protein [uncultured Parabacteroides sp.]
MKKNNFFLLVIVWVLTFVFPVMLSAKATDTRDIELRAKTGNKEIRSLLPVRAWLDNRVVYVSFFELPTEVTVSISDAEGNLIEVCQYQSPEMISIPIVKGTGTFKIEIECDSSIFIGEFKSI